MNIQYIWRKSTNKETEFALVIPWLKFNISYCMIEFVPYYI